MSTEKFVDIDDERPGMTPDQKNMQLSAMLTSQEYREMLIIRIERIKEGWRIFYQ